MNIELKHITTVSKEIQWEIREWRNSKEISQYFIIDYISKEMHSNWLERQKEGITDSAYIIFCDNDPIGCCYFRNINITHKTAEGGIFLRNDSPSKGFGSIIMPKMNEIGFEILNLEKIYLEVLGTNTRARRLYEKFGYKVEGIFKKHIIKNNKREDILLMALFKDDL